MCCSLRVEFIDDLCSIIGGRSILIIEQNSSVNIAMDLYDHFRKVIDQNLNDINESQSKIKKKVKEVEIQMLLVALSRSKNLILLLYLPM